MGKTLYTIVDALILLLCLPVYAVALPALWLFESVRQRRRVRLGLEITHWVAPDVREDYLVVDVSRAGERMVGIRRRRWNVLRARGSPAPPYSDAIEYIQIRRFWVPRPISAWLFSKRRQEDGQGSAGN